MKRGAFISFSDVSTTENESVSTLPSDNTSGPPPVYSGEHAELLLTSKKLLKKDDVTKLKALDELLKLEEYILIDFIPHYCYLFKRLSYDNNRQIREKMCLLLNKLVSNNSKLFTPYMKDIYPTWWVLMSDPCREVSQAAISAYNTAIPMKKRISVLCYLSNSLLKVINLHLSATAETIASIAGDRTLSPEEEEERYERVAVSTLHALKSILESVSPPPTTSSPTTTTIPSEDLLKIFQIDNTPIQPSAKPDKKEASSTPNPSKQLIISIWKLAAHKLISIRQASYVALREFAVRLPIIYNTMKTTTLAQKVIHIVNDEKIDALLQSALDTSVNLLSHCEGIWEYISLSELLKPSILHHLTSAVASGSGEGLGVVGQVGSLDRAVTVLEYITPLIGSIPPSLLAIRSPSSVKYRADIITLLLPPLQSLVHAEVVSTPPPSTRYFTQHKMLKFTALTALLELSLLLLLRRAEASDTTATLGDESVDQAYVSTIFSVLRDSITLAINHIIHALGPVHIGADYTQQLKSSQLFISLQKVCLQLHRATVQGIQFPPLTWDNEVWLPLIETLTHLRDSYLLSLAAGEGEREANVSQGYLVKCQIEGYMANKVHILQALLSLWRQSFTQASGPQASAPQASSTQPDLKPPADSGDQGMTKLFAAMHQHSLSNLTQLSAPQGDNEITFDEQLMCTTLQSEVVSSVLQSLLHLKLLLSSRPTQSSVSESTDDQVLTGRWLMNALTLYTHLDTFLGTYSSKDTTQLSASLLPDLYEVLYSELGKHFQFLASARLQGVHGLDSENEYMALYMKLLELIVSSSSVSLFNMLHATSFISTHVYVKPTIGSSPQESNALFLQWKHDTLTTLISTDPSALIPNHNSDDKVEPVSDVTKSQLTFIVNCLLDELSCGEDSDAEKIITTLYTVYRAWLSEHRMYYSHILINVYRRVCLNADGPQYDRVLAVYSLTHNSTADEGDSGIKIDLSLVLTHLFFSPSPAVVPQIKAEVVPSALSTGQELLLTWDDVESTLLPLLPVDQRNAIHETLLSHISLVTYDKNKPLYSSPAVWVGYFIKILDMLQRQQDSNWTLISTKSPPSGPINRYPSQPRTTLTQSSLFYKVGLFHTEDTWHEWSTKLIDCFNVLHYDAGLKSVTSQLDLFAYTLQALSQLRRYVLYNTCCYIYILKIDMYIFIGDVPHSPYTKLYITYCILYCIMY